MQENLSLFIWILAAIVAAWFLALVINKNMFFNYNADPFIKGNVRIKDTDIGTQCGAGLQDSNVLVEYKFTTDGHIVYLCPQGLWPVQKEVTAVTLTPAFRQSLAAIQLKRIDVFYPETPAPMPMH